MPIGDGITGLNMMLRQKLHLQVCLRQVRLFESVPSPVKHPEKVDMVIFHKNCEDLYADIKGGLVLSESSVHQILNFTF